MKTLLAKLCANRFIACSPDGVLHLTWCQCTLHLSNLDLLQIVQCLEQVQGKLQPGFVFGDRYCQICQPQDDRVILWLLGVGFILTPEELGGLHRLGRMAAKKYHTIAADPIRILVDAELPSYPEIVLSLN